MERFLQIAAYTVFAIMVLAAVLLVLHYAGIIGAANTAWLWGFVWGPFAALAFVGLVFALLVWSDP